MVTFDAGEPGTTAAAWAASERLRCAAHVTEERFSALVVVAAHPDDETLMAGGIIARFAASGRPVTIIVATDGEGSHPASPTITPPELAERRAGEVAEAASRLGVATAPVRLGLPDGRVAEHVATVFEQVSSALTPGSLLVSTWDGDGHPDHEAVARAARRASARMRIAHWQAPIWMWHWGDPEDAHAVPALSRFELSRSDRRRKTMATAAYTSQIAPLSVSPGDEAVLLPDVLEHFTGASEFYVVEASSADFADAADDDAADHSDHPGEPDASLEQEFFDDFYSSADDPWGFETRWYEHRKRDITVASLPRERYTSALELGCSIGVTTAALAERADSVLALDIADKPLAIARRRLEQAEHVRFERRTLPREWPAGTYDLIVMSEMGYYLARDGLRALIAHCRDALTPDGAIVACHWRHPVADYPLSGDAVHELLAESGLTRTVQHIEKDFRLEVYSVDPRSVAEIAGLA